ncbi:unnamed protein product [Hydatigera taeniaeformis]|uniref:Ubiquitin-like domain-containing protein n=1 Tax=Hydatigena taeniaeformis TaxID=6205 RepID=A0A0R3WSW7_HYDTA|nr:unnamed protein product [Hydatigera taeniaeformis]
MALGDTRDLDSAGKNGLYLGDSFVVAFVKLGNRREKWAAGSCLLPPGYGLPALERTTVSQSF